MEGMLGCAMCMGGSKGELAIATTTAIGVLLGILVLVLGSLFAFILVLAKKSRAAAEEEAALSIPVENRDRNRP